MKKLFFIIALSLTTGIILAQTPCENTITIANEKYNDLDFKGAIELIKTCQNPNQSEKAKAARILAKCYLALHEDSMAFRQVENMIEANPYYKIIETEDDPEFIKLVKKVNKIERISLGFNVPVYSKTFPIVHTPYLFDLNTHKQYLKKHPINLYMGLHIAYGISKKSTVQLGLAYSKIGYALNCFNNLSADSTEFKIHYKESIYYLQIPLTYRFRQSINSKWYVSPFAGLNLNLYLTSKFTANILSSAPNSSNITKSELRNGENKNNRNKINPTLNLGTAVGYKFQQNQIQLEFFFQNAFRLTNNPRYRNENRSLVYNYLYVEDDFKLNVYYLVATYSTPIKYSVKRK